MTELRHSGTVHVERPPDEVWDLVADVTRTGEWSPICRGCEWDEGAGPWVGAAFTGHNEHDGRVWSTRSQVVAAERGRVFAWHVNGGWVRWGFELEAEGSGTRLTETWHFTETGLAGFHEKYGEQAQLQIDNRTAAAHDGIPVTLAAIKRIAES